MKIKYTIIAISILIPIVVTAWVFLAIFFNAFSYGMSPIYDISPNYKLIGNLPYYYPDPNYLDYAERVSNDTVESFRVKNNWFLGKTEKDQL